MLAEKKVTKGIEIEVFVDGGRFKGYDLRQSSENLPEDSRFARTSQELEQIVHDIEEEGRKCGYFPYFLFFKSVIEIDHTRQLVKKTRFGEASQEMGGEPRGCNWSEAKRYFSSESDQEEQDQPREPQPTTAISGTFTPPKPQRIPEFRQILDSLGKKAS